MHNHPDVPQSEIPLDALASAFDDVRPYPEEAALRQLGHAILSEILDVILDTALEDRATEICESAIGGLHTAVLRLERQADRSRQALARGLREFDGSEVADHDLQAAKAETDRCDAAVRALELIRDAAAEAYATGTGEAWGPWRGGVRRSPISAAQIDASHALRAATARQLADADPGPELVVLRGAPAANSPEDASRVFDALNWAHTRFPRLSIGITGAPGAERFARQWAQQKKVPLVVARPDFDKHGRAAPFRANDALLALKPVCVLTLASSLEGPHATPFGPVLSLAQEARRQGVRCIAIRSGPA